ncbi:heme biosynthesis protein HemY [Paracoccus zhejiangensis]|uniref:Heme biosynthesis protein HemY n=1 Tax=Paracoccus zhejiangensis TaxID=1077935 RepID=A0A2H5F2A7_9RHOB|nr:heme biosynthesis HemY N-terminal domain-containing protein [Paracoccus zhejiangensis]AUH65662.1 heme biosynthesis protein HemY [Paracoccus zhejiangensis]
MLLSLLKILFFFAVVLAVALGAMHLSETGQSLRLEFNGTEYLLGPVQVIIGLLVLMVAAWLAMKLLGLFVAFLRFLAGDETAINRYFARSRERRGYEALGEGMLAVAAGEGKLAQEKAAKAEKYLDKPHVTNLLAAQAAEVAGDTTRADAVYRKLLEDDRTRFVGVRGLMRQKLLAGDTETALKLAEKAYALKPRHKEVQDTLLELQTQRHDWKGARGVLKDQRKQGDLPKDVHIRRDAVLALQEASEVLAQGNSISAREAAISANRASPDLIPAAVLAARSYMAKDDPRHASRVLEKTWSVRPHPDIAAAYAEIVPDETPVARQRRFENLIRKNPDDQESRLLRAELALAAEDFPGARRALGNLAETQPTVRTLSIMAAVERGEGADDAVVRGWLARALTASRGPQWCCDKCQNVMVDWAPVCDKCGGFDTLSWRVPDEKLTATTGRPGAEMLPLLVGASPKPATVVAEEAEIVTETPKPAPKPNGAAPRAATERATRVEVAAVAPGMVPREVDFVEIEPSSTDTSPEPAREVVKPAPAPATEKAPLNGTVMTDTAKPVPAEPVLVRPDVEPPEDEVLPPSGKKS